MKALMKQSHESLRTLYECSHENLDRIVDLSDQLGVGTRLTGAGWGGCVVALCDGVEESKRFVETLKTEFYASIPKAQTCDIGSLCFTTSPQRGAEIYLIQKQNNILNSTAFDAFDRPEDHDESFHLLQRIAKCLLQIGEPTQFAPVQFHLFRQQSASKSTFHHTLVEIGSGRLVRFGQAVGNDKHTIGWQLNRCSSQWIPFYQLSTSFLGEICDGLIHTASLCSDELFTLSRNGGKRLFVQSGL
uniref:GHMP kinase C-terminal domain-containing protein n=1 Tax=Anopheles culicifacies TaxID=139723 RepID=A0A182M2U6_9DIPT